MLLESGPVPLSLYLLLKTEATNSGRKMDFRELVASHAFLSAYLRYNEGNESPAIYHLWGALGAVSACLGRKVHLANGNLQIYPNLYTVFVGPPAVRKSSAISIVRALVGEASRVRFAPADIAGQKQGLLAHLADDMISEDDDENAARSKSRNGLDLMDTESWMEGEVSIGSPLDRSSVFICANELVSFAGMASTALLAALGDLYDCPPNYEYKLKRSTLYVDRPVLQLLGATTPSQLPQIMPPEVINQGLLSRIIFVHAAKPNKRIARPLAGDERSRQRILQVLQDCFFTTEGALDETKDEMEFVDALYDSEEAATRVTDPRLQYYVNRRHAHLRKLTMIVAMSDGCRTIELRHAQLAHAILCATEDVMGDALGEYGSSAESRIRQQIVDYLAQQRGTLTFNELHHQLQHACPKRTAFAQILQELVEGDKVLSVTDQFDPSGGPVTRYCTPNFMADKVKRTELLKALKDGRKMAS